MDKVELKRKNIILSAPTSFGKSLVIDALVKSGEFNNILIIVPTIALIDETRRRLSKLYTEHKVITHKLQKPSHKNIYVLTQERVFEGVKLDNLDLFIIDEFYKLSPDQNQKDETRYQLLNKAFYILNKRKKQFYLLGPNVSQLSPEFRERVNCQFIEENYQTVASEVHFVEKQGTDIQTLVSLCREIEGQTIIYCQSPNRASKVSKELISADILQGSTKLRSAIDWISKEFHPEWHFVKALSKGIGIHHGKIPRAITQFVTKAFDENLVKFLVCTSTLIEGVNTKARNVIIFDNKISTRKFDYFTYNNIKGRSGRMFKHFVGHVYLFHVPPSMALPTVDVPIFSQSDKTSESLLIQIDDEDLTQKSRQRLEEYKEQDVVPYETLKENITIDLDSQIRFAEKLKSRLEFYYSRLNWTENPNKEQLDTICDLIWDYFNGRKLVSRSIYNARELSYRTFQVINNQNLRDLINQQINRRKTPDEAVDEVLYFIRNWVTFNFPRLLRAMNRIQKFIFGRSYETYGDFDTFAERLENFFLDPAIFALDEYGIPFQLGRKLEPALQPNGNLDLALQRLKELEINSDYFHPFELELIRNAQDSLPSKIINESLF